MTFTFKTAATALALTMVLGSGSAFAKAHDQGVADGDISFPDGTGAAELIDVRQPVTDLRVETVAP